jgi:hypothetical protein
MASPTQCAPMSERYQRVGQGDDGVVVHDRQTGNAVKIYNLDPSYSEQKKSIRREQANRELKALRALGPHPNIIKLLEEDLVDVDDLSIGSWCIRASVGIVLEYLPHLASLRDAACVWGFVPKASADAPKAGMNFERRNQILKRVLSQAFRLLSFLEDRRLRHRDLDSTNLMIQLPEMTLKAMDFARADVPGLRNPDEIVREALAEIRAGSADGAWKDIRDAYENPVNANCKEDCLPPGIQYTDRMAMKYTLKRELNAYMQGSFHWVDFGVTQAVVNENLTMLALFGSLWTQNDADVQALLRVGDTREAMRFIRNNATLCYSLVKYNRLGRHSHEAKVFYTDLAATRNDVRCARTVMHSSDHESQPRPADPLAL